MSRGHDMTYYHDFAATGGPFAEFMNWIESIVGEAQWSLAGHSGAGDVIAKSLNLNPSVISKFNAIELLDAAYNIHHVAGRFRSGSEAALWQTIAERNPSLTLTCIGNGTIPAVRCWRSRPDLRPSRSPKLMSITAKFPMLTLARGCAAASDPCSRSRAFGISNARCPASGTGFFDRPQYISHPFGG
jgi:hypothetical protein